MNMMKTWERTPWKWSIAFFISWKISSLSKRCEECHNRGFRGQTSNGGLMGLRCSRGYLAYATFLGQELSSMDTSLVASWFKTDGSHSTVSFKLQCDSGALPQRRSDHLQMMTRFCSKVLEVVFWFSYRPESGTFPRCPSVFLSVLVTKETTGSN